MKIISSKQYVSEILKARKAQVIKENEMCPMGMLFGPVVKPKDKVDYKS